MNTAAILYLMFTMTATAAPGDRPRAGPPNPPLAETRSAMTSEPSTVPAQQTNTVSVGLRVVGESLAGGFCAGILGGIGFRVGTSVGGTYGHSYALVGAALGLMVGVGAGSWLGVQLVGSWLGGRGNPWFTLLGAASGMLAGFLVATFIPSLGLAAVLLLPLVGAVLGYEASSTPPSPRVALHEESRARILPVVGLAPGGRGLLPGLAGTF